MRVYEPVAKETADGMTPIVRSRSSTIEGFARTSRSGSAAEGTDPDKGDGTELSASRGAGPEGVLRKPPKITRLARPNPHLHKN